MRDRRLGTTSTKTEYCACKGTCFSLLIGVVEPFFIPVTHAMGERGSRVDVIRAISGEVRIGGWLRPHRRKSESKSEKRSQGPVHVCASLTETF